MGSITPPDGFQSHLENIGNALNQADAAAIPDKKQEYIKAANDFQTVESNYIQKPTQQGLLKMVDFYRKTDFPQLKARVISTFLSLNNSILDGVMMDLLSILQTELGGDVGFDMSFLSALVQRLETVSKQSTHPEYLSAFQTILSNNINGIQDPTLKQTVQQILQGINVGDMAAIETESIQTQQLNPNALGKGTTPASATVEVVGATKAGAKEGFDISGDVARNKDIKVKMNPSSTITAEIQLENGFIQALGTLSNMDMAKMKTFIAAIIQISNIPPVFVISSIVSQLLVQMGKLEQDKTLYKIAIVTDNIAALREIDSVDYIRKIDSGYNVSFHAFYEQYKQLYEEGYHYIISLHLNQNLKKTYASACAAKTYIQEQGIQGLDIEVHNTNANGVGLGMMIYALNDAIKSHYSPVEVNQLAIQLVENYQHWVCPLEFDFVKNHRWVMDLADTQKKVQLKLFHFIPVVELDKKLSITSVSYTKDTALTSLVQTLDQHIKDKNKKVTRICVEYRGVYREAIRIRNRIKVRYPTIKVSLQSVGTLTTKFFGPELVGVCLI